ncbi:hypothetical protein CWB63_18550, partial [Pseudoalteromonas sp. S409]
MLNVHLAAIKHIIKAAITMGKFDAFFRDSGCENALHKTLQLNPHVHEDKSNFHSYEKTMP